MKTYKNLYERLCSIENLNLAYQKARKEKSKSFSVIEFEKNLNVEIRKLYNELITYTYRPIPLRRFVIRDPKTRVIHASAFRDRIVHHALINIIGPIFEKIFIYDSYASRIDKGTHNAVTRFDYFKRRVSKNGKIVRSGGGANGNSVEGYVLKCDIKHYFETVDHEILVNLIRKKIKDEKVIWLIRQILNNFDDSTEGKGMPLGNYTSQFFANVYLNELDYFVKHILKAKYYIRYVDDFVILHKRKKILEIYKDRVNRYLKCLELELHPEKSKTIPLRNGVSFLGYRIFYHHKMLRKRNMSSFQKKFDKKIKMCKEGIITKEMLIESLQGWIGYAKWASTYNFRRKILKKVEELSKF